MGFGVTFFAFALAVAAVYWLIPHQRLRVLWLSLASLGFVARADWGAAAVVAALTLYSVRVPKVRAATVIVTAVIMVGFYFLQAKVWGVVLMGMSLMVFFALPYLDRSKVKSVRYRGWLYKLAVAIFVVAFVVLGYLGTQPASGLKVVIAQVGTIVYFAFFLLMPWYTTLDKTKPVPERLT